MRTWAASLSKVLLTWAAAGIVGAIAVQSVEALIEPGVVRDIGVVALWITALGSGTVLSFAWITADRAKPTPIRTTELPPAIWNDASAQYARGLTLHSSLEGLSGSPDENARTARTALDKWERETRDALREAHIDAEDLDAPISGLDGMHFADRPLEILRIKLERLRVLLQ